MLEGMAKTAIANGVVVMTYRIMRRRRAGDGRIDKAKT